VTTYINDREAAALREDSLSYTGDLAIKRLGERGRVYGPVRTRLRFTGRRPRCRACGQFIENRTLVIQFRWKDRPYQGIAYIHLECPEVGSDHAAH
jgi:hypothetical protein